MQAEKAKTRSRRLRVASLTAAALLGVVPVALAQGGTAAVKATAEEWQAALTAVKQVALDAAQAGPRRANAVMAYAKLQSLRSQHADAIQTCWEVLKVATAAELAEAAVRAAGFVARQLHGHLGGPVELIDDWIKKAPSGPGRAALGKVRMDLVKARQYLMGVAARKMPPGPIRTRMPGWAVIRPKSGVPVLNLPSPRIVTPRWMAIQKDRGPSALRVSLPAIPPSALLSRDKAGVPRALQVSFPEYTAPNWYKRVGFPLLKEDKKK